MSAQGTLVPLVGCSEAYSGCVLYRRELGDGVAQVVKRMSPAWDWIMRVTGDEGRVGVLWRSGAMHAVPPVIDHAVVDTRFDGEAWEVVMRDVSDALVGPEATIDRPAARRVLNAAAALHDRFRAVHLDGLCSLEDRYRMFAPRAIRELAITHPRARLAAEAWGLFADLAPPDVAGPVLTILDRPALLAGRLARCPEQTLVHGDLKLQNLGFAGGRLVALDWGSLTGVAPPAVDFAWFLGQNANRIAAPREAIIDDFRATMGERHDERALQLSLLGAVVHFGWKLAHRVVEASGPEEGRRARSEFLWWMMAARDGLEAW